MEGDTNSIMVGGHTFEGDFFTAQEPVVSLMEAPKQTLYSLQTSDNLDIGLKHAQKVNEICFIVWQIFMKLKFFLHLTWSRMRGGGGIGQDGQWSHFQWGF